MEQVTFEEAEHKIKDLITRAAGGDTIVITDSTDRPIAKIGPCRPTPKKREAGHAKGRVRMAPDFDALLEDFEEYMP